MHNRELEAFRSFINTIYSTPVKGIGEDKRCWLPCKSKGFKVSAYYHLLVGHSDEDQGTASKDLVQVPIGPVTRA